MSRIKLLVRLVGTYNAVRSAPSQVSTQYMRMSNGTKHFLIACEDKYDRLVGRPPRANTTTNVQPNSSVPSINNSASAYATK